MDVNEARIKSEMILENINSEWKKDSPIDESNISGEALSIPKLQSKYIDFLTRLKLALVKTERDFNKMKNIKSKYYRGEMGKEELDKYGWVQYQGNKPLKTELETFLKSDDDLNDYGDIMKIQQATIDVLEKILKEINNRNFHCRVAVDWNKFINGG